MNAPLGGYYQPNPNAPPEPTWTDTGFDWTGVFNALTRRALREAALETIQASQRRRPPCECAACGNRHHPTIIPTRALGRNQPPGRPLPPRIDRSWDPEVIAADPDRAIPEPTAREKNRHRAKVRRIPRKPLYYTGPVTGRDGVEYVLRDGQEVPITQPSRRPTFRMEENSR